MPGAASRPLWPGWARSLFVLQFLLNVIMWVALSVFVYAGARVRESTAKDLSTQNALLEIRVRNLERAVDVLRPEKGMQDAD